MQQECNLIDSPPPSSLGPLGLVYSKNVGFGPSEDLKDIYGVVICTGRRTAGTRTRWAGTWGLPNEVNGEEGFAIYQYLQVEVFENLETSPNGQPESSSLRAHIRL